MLSRSLLPCVVALAAAGCAAPRHDMRATAPPADDGAMVDLVEARCGVCHGTDVIYGSVGTEGEWMEVVHRMVYHHKAKLLSHVTDEEAMRIAAWLAGQQRPERGSVRIGATPSGRAL